MFKKGEYFSTLLYKILNMSNTVEHILIVCKHKLTDLHFESILNSLAVVRISKSVVQMSQYGFSMN